MKLNLSNNISKKIIFYSILLNNYSGSYLILKRRNDESLKETRWQCTNLCIFGILIAILLLIISCSCYIWFVYRYKTKLNDDGGNRDTEQPHLQVTAKRTSALIEEAAEQFTRVNPPEEDLPFPEHIEEIQAFGGARAWHWDVSAEELDQIVLIEDEGDIIKFLKDGDVRIQTNYPCFVPVIEGGEGTVTEGGGQTLHYYEMTILENRDPSNNIAIGLATKPYPYFRLPGLHRHSVGYHSIDGKKYNDNKNGMNYGPIWAEIDDTVGCGYNSDSGVVFFTKNGESLGDAFVDIKHIWFPTIGASGPCTVEINFGNDLDNEYKYKEAIGYGPCGPIMSSKKRSLLKRHGRGKKSTSGI